MNSFRKYGQRKDSQRVAKTVINGQLRVLAKMAKYEKSFTTAFAPRHPVDMASTAKPPDPMSCALASVLLPESRAHG
jgi:hypothetical protein